MLLARENETMSTAYNKVRDAALKLSREQRISLAHGLLASVVHEKFPPGPKVTAEEIVASAREVLNGTAKTVDAFRTLDRLDRKFSRERAKAA
jgi:hypothetical protein